MRLVTNDLRKAGVKIRTGNEKNTGITKEDRERTDAIVQRYSNSVFSNHIGKIKTDPVELQYGKGFKPIQPPRILVPFHYQERLARHLEKLREEEVIEDIDPREPIDCLLNVSISDKKEERDQAEHRCEAT